MSDSQSGNFDSNKRKLRGGKDLLENDDENGIENENLKALTFIRVYSKLKLKDAFNQYKSNVDALIEKKSKCL